ncbi:MAG TPA: 4-hydroxyphenylacetate 3-monooxygenase, oxygenase component [Bryobacteraceae bacterium]|nr:4-hydroxyphenylacetate 3-monooxygenase, oxygenase component [Bryobacteraceae bacterium]
MSQDRSGTGARHGADVLERLRNNPPNLWYDGQKVEDPTAHPAMRRGVETLASLYDRQWSEPELTLCDSPSGFKISRTFQIPRTSDELRNVTRTMKARADWHFGMLGRAPDYLNRAIAGYASGAAFLGEEDARFGENARSYYEYVRDNDLCLTHTLITPQANRSVGSAKQADPFLAARIKEETAAGLVIQGCRMLATLPFADELMVFPSTLLKNQEEDAPYAFGLCLPTNTPGLKFLCRESLDYGRSHYDHPFGSRFEELDSVVIFDNVFVPWERVLLYRDVARCNAAYARTGALACMSHQVVVKDLAKTEYLMGLASLMAHAIGIEGFQHIQEKLAEIWVNMETMRAFLRAAEADATLDEYGMLRPAWDPLDAARNLYPRLYPRMIEIIQQMGASGLVAMPTEADVRGPMAAEIERYFQAARAEAHDRIPLFRLAWDTAVSAFASRQVLYERFFFGDPVRMAGALATSHDRSAYLDRVREFLAQAKSEAQA